MKHDAPTLVWQKSALLALGLESVELAYFLSERDAQKTSKTSRKGTLGLHFLACHPQNCAGLNRKVARDISLQQRVGFIIDGGEMACVKE